MTRNDEEAGLLEDGADPGYGTAGADLALKTYPLKIFQHQGDSDGGAPPPPGPFPMDSLDYIEHAMNERIPPICAMGMQRMETRLVEAAIEHAADMIDAGEHRQSPLSSLKGEAKLQRVYEKKNLANTIRKQWEEHYPEPIGPPVKTAIMLSSIWFSLVGYNIGIMNVAESVMFPGHTVLAWTWAVAAYPVGGFVGAILAMPVADRQGRKVALMVLTILYLIGGTFQAVAPGMPMIQTTRIILGIASGMSTTMVPIYLGEVVPAYMRGQVGGLLRRSQAMGILISLVMPFLFNEGSSWRWWVSFNVVLPVIPLLQIYNLVESPRWMLQREPDSVEARRNLARCRAAESMSEMEAEALLLTRALEDTKPASTDSVVKHPVLACCLLQMSQQLSGVYAIMYYSSWMMSEYTEFGNIATLMLGFVYFLATAGGTPNSLLQSNFSRRHKLLGSIFAMMVCAILLRVTWGGSPAIMVTLLAAYVALYAIGLSPLPNLLVVELVDVNSVTRTSALCQQVNWGVHAIVAFAFPFLWVSLGRSTFEIIIWVLVVSTAGLPQLVPSVAGKTSKQYYTSLKRQRPAVSLHV